MPSKKREWQDFLDLSRDHLEMPRSICSCMEDDWDHLFIKLQRRFKGSWLNYQERRSETSSSCGKALSKAGKYELFKPTVTYVRLAYPGQLTQASLPRPAYPELAEYICYSYEWWMLSRTSEAGSCTLSDVDGRSKILLDHTEMKIM